MVAMITLNNMNRFLWKRARQNIFHFAGAMHGVPTKLILWGKVRNRERVPHKAEL